MKDMTMEFSNEYAELVMSTEISADNVTSDVGHSPPEALSILYNVLVILQVRPQEYHCRQCILTSQMN